ncbi:hypothetical protein [Escherichia coli]|uniref:hypothetical protein n=1 Tax=Escherichia coli TaxID=562 RepID=UPI001080137F|nr:hypothetical protein [Escherichia coli]TGH01660.1 hypothetical protein E5S62_02040 [Escherichia coli]
MTSTEGGSVGHFEDLCCINRDVERKRCRAAEILRDEARRLVGFYEDWLGLPSLYREHEHGESRPYVETGLPCRNAEDFHACSVNQIPVAADNIFYMTVRTWIESLSGIDPIDTVVAFELHSVSEDRATLNVTVEDDIFVRVSIAAPEDRKWAEVTKSMKRHIAHRLKKRTPFALR